MIENNKESVLKEQQGYIVYDRFFAIWLKGLVWIIEISITMNYEYKRNSYCNSGIGKHNVYQCPTACRLFLQGIYFRKSFIEIHFWNYIQKISNNLSKSSLKQKGSRYPPKRYTKSLETVSIKRGVRKVESSFFRFL